MIHRSISDVRDLSEIVGAGDRLILTDNEEPVAVVLDPGDFRSLEATVMLANDPDNLSRVLAAAEQLRREAENAPVKLNGFETCTIDGVQLVTHRVDTPECDLKTLADQLRRQMKHGVVILGTATGSEVKLLTAITTDLVEISANKLLHQLAPMIDGKVTGDRFVAQAAGTGSERLDAALTAAAQILREALED